MLHQTAQVRQQTLDYHRGARRSLRKMLDLLAAAKSVGGWVSSLWRFARRPRLHVYFDAAQTYMIRTVTDAGGVPGYFCHVMVRNHGHDVARKCRGRLTAVLQRDADGRTAPAQASSLPWFSNGPTKWTGTGTLVILSTMFVVGWTSAMR